MTARVGNRRHETGFTLVELLVAVAILGIIGAAVTESVIIGLRTTTRTEAQVRGSIDRQQLARYFVPDVQSAQKVEATPCPPGASLPAGSTPSVTLSRIDRGVRTTASYYFVEAPPEASKLLRRVCELDLIPAEPPGPPERVTEQVVADHLGAPAPVVDCPFDKATCKLTVTDAQAVPFTLSASRRAA